MKGAFASRTGVISVLAVLGFVVALHVNVVVANGSAHSGHTAGITLDEARSLLQAALQFYTNPHMAGLAQCTVILDAEAVLKAAVCVDGTPPIAQQFAIQKGTTAVSFAGAYNQTKMKFNPFEDLYKVDSVFGYTNVGGAIPLFDANGSVVGAIAVSGAPSAQQDLDVAVAALAGRNGRVTAAELHVAVGTNFPFLADALTRLAASEQQAISLGVSASFCVNNDAGNYVLFYRMDNSVLATVSAAKELARSAVVTQMNTIQLSALAQPGGTAFTFDNSNGDLVVAPGGRVFYNSVGHVLGSVGTFTGMNSTIDNMLSTTAVSASSSPNLPAILDLSISLSSAFAVANAALASARANSVTATIVIVGRNGVPKVIVSTDDASPVTVPTAIKKAQTSILLPFPGYILNTIMRPGSLYDLANAAGGLVTCGGSNNLLNSAGVSVGAIGVVSDGGPSMDNIIVAAAGTASSTGTTATGITLPATPFVRRPGRAVSGITLSTLIQVCGSSVNAAGAPVTCVARDGSGTVRYLAANDGVVPSAVDFAVRSSEMGYFSVSDASQIQFSFNPFLNMSTGQGMHFTAENAVPGRLVALPGGVTLVLDEQVVGSIGVSSGLSRPNEDQNAALAGVVALPSFYTGTPGCPKYQTLQIVDSYLAQLFVQGNVAAAATYTAGSNFTFTWNGPTNLVPIAGTFSGSNALQTFFGNTFRLIKNFQLNLDFAPATNGVRTVSVDCNVVVKQWQEVSVVISTGKAISNALNTVLYRVSNGKIISADVYVDSMQYAQAFCGSEVTCAAGGSSGSSNLANTCDSSEILQSVRGFGATILVLVIIILVVLIFLSRPARNTRQPDSGVPYSAM